MNNLKDRLLDPGTTSQFGLAGNKGPEFEAESQRFTSDIQAFVGTANSLVKSQDLISGRMSRQIPFHPYFKPASTPPVSFPDGLEGKAAPWGPYKSKGPTEGRY